MRRGQSLLEPISSITSAEDLHFRPEVAFQAGNLLEKRSYRVGGWVVDDTDRYREFAREFFWWPGYKTPAMELQVSCVTKDATDVEIARALKSKSGAEISLEHVLAEMKSRDQAPNPNVGDTKTIGFVRSPSKKLFVVCWFLGVWGEPPLFYDFQWKISIRSIGKSKKNEWEFPGLHVLHRVKS